MSRPFLATAPLWPAVLAAFAVALLVRRPGRPAKRLDRRLRAARATRAGRAGLDQPAGRDGGPGSSDPSRGWLGRRAVVPAGWLVLLLAGGVVLVSVAGAGGVVTAAAVALLVGATIKLRSGRRANQAAAARRARVIEACAVLSADLRAGRPPQVALAAASEVCAELGPAAEIAKLGGDVGAALAESSAAPGAGGLAALGAAWRVVERSGVALSAVAARLAESLRADETARRQAAAALAGTRSTARLLAGLPLLGTALGHLLGAEPVSFLTSTPPGWFCLLAGVALMVAGLAWVERLIAEPRTESKPAGRDRATRRHPLAAASPAGAPR